MSVPLLLVLVRLLSVDIHRLERDARQQPRRRRLDRLLLQLVQLVQIEIATAVPWMRLSAYCGAPNEEVACAKDEGSVLVKLCAHGATQAFAVMRCFLR